MRNNLNGHRVVGELPDSFILQNSKGVTRQIQKAEIERYGKNEGLISNGIAPKTNENFGMKASRIHGELKAKGQTKDQIASTFTKDATYKAAYGSMSPEDKKAYGKALEGVSESERVRMAQNLRSNYRDKKYDDMQYKASGQASRDLDAEVASMTKPYGTYQSGRNKQG